jgi:hypothetical protein
VKKEIKTLQCGGTKRALTSGADFLLVDSPYFHGLRDALQVDGVVAAQVAAVLQLGEAPAIESSATIVFDDS